LIAACCVGLCSPTHIALLADGVDFSGVLGAAGAVAELMAARRRFYAPGGLPVIMKTYIPSNHLIAGGRAMSKEAVFTMKLETELRAEFMAEAEAAHRPASQILRELMREFVQRQREMREYDEFLRRKVESGRASMRAGLGRPNEEVEAEFAARRAQVVG